ncbi:hypothetical protein MROS_1434 [Melioribacter roseus P3M-2]|uniref:Uncharacterized protein n=1 Tax=Melioribacter roseus (strain DSM 23840 / JCM 17771 / VKM B-2668 / P3M-2) TaxID=1191523 RepID=I7A445_MELRP|nr:hypothetical protein [Melioribacter roseus]AFN74671.1 hypothetical protein MROS_1434 [Melioribacter roseus P3M-2]
MNGNNIHKFHIPVLGVGYSIDTPLKVAKYGISSVMSLVDDTLMEKLRKHYLEKRNKTYVPIESDQYDSRAKRTTAYLNMIGEFVEEDFAKLKSTPFEEGSEINKYFEMLRDDSDLKRLYNRMLKSNDPYRKKLMEERLRNGMKPGSIDVNIMTKVDKSNYDKDGTLLPSEFNDAHAALRGFAQSNLKSKIIFSAGMNPRLYGYIAAFDDFYPDYEGNFKKKIVIKVSDFRSALIQGKFLAKKGLWVSEFRIESGLNCGGHAFATDGLLLGPILEEFKNRKDELINSLKEIYLPSINKKGIDPDESKLGYELTVQGGVGKSSEQEFLIRYYGVSSVGWGSLFLMVPEATNVDDYTLEKLCEAREEDLYLSEISPLGVPFNNLRDNSKDIEKFGRAEAGKPGSPCPKKYLVSNKEFTDKPICTASITYIKKKIAQLKNTAVDPAEYEEAYGKTIDKACLCEGLTVTPLILNDIPTPKQSRAVSVCPGPNIAYYSQKVSLKEMVDHIYGRIDLVTDKLRPNMFVKELTLYTKYYEKLRLKSKTAENSFEELAKKTEIRLKQFHENLLEGIKYYQKIIPEIMEESYDKKQEILASLYRLEQKLISFIYSESQPVLS